LNFCETDSSNRNRARHLMNSDPNKTARGGELPASRRDR
jgi:hypothetical protein